MPALADFEVTVTLTLSVAGSDYASVGAMVEDVVTTGVQPRPGGALPRIRSVRLDALAVERKA